MLKASYTVRHYQENLTDDEYTMVNEVTTTVNAGDKVTPALKSYSGFVKPDAQTITVAADNSSVVEYYYSRKRFTVTWNYMSGSLSEDDELHYEHFVVDNYDDEDDYSKLYDVKYGTYIPTPNVERRGYTLAGWFEDPEADPEIDEYYSPGNIGDDMVHYAVWIKGEEETDPSENTGDIYSVKLGMTTAELTTLLGSPTRIDSTPQGYQGYVYNKDGTYENYILVYVDNGIVVGMASMSPNSGYDGFNIGDDPTENPLIGFKGMGNSYDYNGACYRTTDTEHMVAFIDYNGMSCVYAMLIFSTTDGNGNAVELEDLILAENLTYDSDTIADSATQMADWVNAYRYYLGLDLVQYVASGTKTGADAAQKHSEDMAKNDFVDTASSDGTTFKTRFDTNYRNIAGMLDGDTLGKAENVGGRSPDAFGFVTWWIDNSADTYGNIAKDLSENGFTYYLCTGFAYSSTSSTITYGTLDFFY